MQIISLNLLKPLKHLIDNLDISCYSKAKNQHKICDIYAYKVAT